MKRFITILVAVLLAGWVGWLFIPTIPAITEPDSTGYLDMHVHTAGIGAGGSGIYVNPTMRDNVRFPFYLWAFGVDEEDLEAHGDELVLKRLNTSISLSERVDSVVVLALDGVIDDNGRLDEELTQIYVPNEFVAEAARKYPHLEFGASVNPYRADALERLERAKAEGALLVKWIPNVMHIDPADRRIKPFYEKLKELELPLLTHAGQERSFAFAVDEYGDPQKLRFPLELGVTVIAAHVATTGTNHGERNIDRLLPLFEEFPNLYTEVSSLTQINKLGYLVEALGVTGLRQRMLYGTDWPLQFFPLVSPVFHLRHVSFSEARSVSEIGNTWDRDVALKEAMGVPQAVFERSRKLLLPDR